MIATTLWLRGFALTLAIEEPLGVFLLGGIEASNLRRIAAVFLVNLATHPLVWFFFPHLGWSRPLVAWTAEGWAFGFEALAYRIIFPRAPWKRCALVSVVANVASFGVGTLAARSGFFE